MAGPSGAGMVQAYLRMSRANGAGRSQRRDYLTALRREVAKYGRDPDLVEFDCFFLCMSCGRLTEPRLGDPMRTEAQQRPQSCASCGAVGLVDLRETPMVHELCALEGSERAPSLASRVGKIFRVLGLALAASGFLLFVDLTLFGALSGPLGGRFMLPVLVLVTALAGWLASSRFMAWRSASRRALPRRWRIPLTSKRSGVQPHERVRDRVEGASELLHAPLSGRPCVAYEVAVRDDDVPKGPLASWRLLEQDNVGFRVGALAVEPGEALLQLRREPFSHGTIGGMDAATRRYMRMRGLLDSEAVHVYETILVAGDACEVSRRKLDAPLTLSRR